MRKTTKLFLGFTAGLLLLCGCSAAEEKLGYENADVAKEALASASSACAVIWITLTLRETFMRMKRLPRI